MTATGLVHGLPLTATDCGRICAVAGQGQREMREWAAAYPELYGAEAFDPALFGTLSLASAFSGPWFDNAQLRTANRVCLWCFGLDWLIDYAAGSAAQVRTIVERCMHIAAGGPPVGDDALSAFLADIRAELAAAPAFAELEPVWRDELGRMLRAMALEWEWRNPADGATGPSRPTFEQYLDNADNLGFCFVFASHWIATQETERVADVAAVTEAARRVQRVIRLLNDLGTYERDLQWGDLNALMLGVDRTAVEQRIRELAEEARRVLRPLAAAQPRLAGYLERQMDFCAGFYRVTDFWGRP